MIKYNSSQYWMVVQKHCWIVCPALILKYCFTNFIQLESKFSLKLHISSEENKENSFLLRKKKDNEVNWRQHEGAVVHVTSHMVPTLMEPVSNLQV